MSVNLKKDNIKVLVIDPHQIILWGISELLKDHPKILISGTSSSSSDALKKVTLYKPDVIVLEPELLDEDGVDLIPALLQSSSSKIIVFTGSKNTNIHDQVVVKGARGVINKNEHPDILIKAIEKIHEGELWLNRNATSRILLQIAQANSPKIQSSEQQKLSTLTQKEEKVTRAIQMYSEMTLKQVAQSLHISEHTLRNHLASVYDKLGVRNRLELYVFCGKYQKTGDPSNHPKRRSSDI